MVVHVGEINRGKELMKEKTIILSLIAGVFGIFAGIRIGFSSEIKKRRKLKELSDKHFVLMCLLNQWMKTKQEGKTILKYFHDRQIDHIAIYGMSYVGERLYDELKDSDIEVKYIVDRNADKIYTEADVFTPDETLPEVGAIVVTPVFYYDEIKEMLSQKVNCPIFSLEDILYGL